MNVETVYTSCCVNRSPHCLDWHPGGNEVLFGSCNAVVVSRLEGNVLRIWKTLVEHTSKVNLVRWLTPDLFVSASTDSTARVWKRLEGSFSPWTCLRHPSGSVTCAAGYFDPDEKAIYVATASTNSTISIWKVDDSLKPDEVSSTQVLPIAKNGFALDLQVDRIPSGIFFLFASTDKTNVIIYLSKNGTDFIPSHVLTGHEDWVQSISVILDGKNLLVATAGQDSFIRLWKITPVTKEKALEEAKLVKDLGPEEEIRLKEDVFSLNDEFYFTVVLESVLAGHEDKVYGLQWKKLPSTGELTLLSCSMDKTMIRWTYDNESGIWIEQVRVGEIGGNTLGFLGCTSHSDGSTLIGYNFSGAIHLWKEVSERSWQPEVSPSGHHGPVLDLDWDRKGRYFFTVGSDQTTRVHGPWKQHTEKITIWAEMGRPQVHGHDLSCITALPFHRFASGAEEKITRIFEATRNFLENFARLAQIDLSTDIETKDAQGASVPSLGLSNKAVKSTETGPINEESRHVKDMFPDVYFKPETYIQPPSEDSLCQNTLWPELHKLYGHGYEIFSLASNHEGNIIASACKAAKAEHAQVILWDAITWKQLDRLSGHTLTVTQMEFSPCDNFLLTVSRDRTWCLFSRIDNQFTLIAQSDKTTSVHQRLLWSCSWSKDSKYFCTASRDKKIAIWTRTNRSSGTCLGEYGLACDKPLVLGDSVTAVAFSPLNLRNGSYMLVAGLESGDLILISWSEEEGWNILQTLEKNEAHHKTIKRIRFCPDKSNLLFASCGEDNLVKLYLLDKNHFCE